MRRHPDVRIEMLATEAFLDIAAGEADVALRSGPPPTDPRLIVRKVDELAWAIYGSADYIARHGAPARPQDLAGHLVVGAEGRLDQLPQMRWLAGQADRYACRVSTMSSMIGMARAGAGLALLPEMNADPHPELVRCLPNAAPATQVWLVTRQDVRQAPHVRALIDFIYETVRAPPRRSAAAG
jgi:DNA-binding transcriptional LysR family regulator